MKLKFTKKIVIWAVVILAVGAVVAYFALLKPKDSNNIQTAVVSRQNLEETVLATGQVVSVVDLSLAFQGSGMVNKVAVKEGDIVKKGMVLATINQSQAIASLTTAQGSLLQAKANYEKLITGATPEDIKTIQDQVDSAQQKLTTYYASALNVLNDSYLKIYNASTAIITIQNNYFLKNDIESLRVQQSRETIDSSLDSSKDLLDKAEASANQADIDSAVAGVLFNLNKTSDALQVVREQADSGVYYSIVSSADKTILDTQKANVNTAIVATTDIQYNIYSAKIALKTANNQLALKTAPPRQSDIDFAKAQMLSAQGQVDSARANLNNLVLTAPEDGTITLVDIKVGEQAIAMQQVIILQNVNELHTEADVSEANIASMAIGQPIDYTFDAFGPDQHFPGTIININPASTVISGVVNYKIKGTLDNIPGIKPGMTANFTILVAKKDDALSVPSTAIINKNNSYYVRVIDDAKKKTYHETQVQTGIQADGGLVEIVSGLEDGQEIVIYMK